MSCGWPAPAAAFPYSATHADYIVSAARRDRGVALTAERVTLYAPQPGDLICAWRGQTPVSFDELPTAGRFPGHCDIVVGRKPGELDVIGGNVDNAVTMKPIPVTADGRLAGLDGIVLDPEHHWLVVLRVLYQRPGNTAAGAGRGSAGLGARPKLDRLGCRQVDEFQPRLDASDAPVEAVELHRQARIIGMQAGNLAFEAAEPADDFVQFLALRRLLGTDRPQHGEDQIAPLVGHLRFHSATGRFRLSGARLSADGGAMPTRADAASLPRQCRCHYYEAPQYVTE